MNRFNLLLSHPMLVIGITGGSGSGKSYIVSLLQSQLNAGQATFISQDDYYHVLDKIPRDENGIPNFDLPESLDIEGIVNDIQLLRSRQSFVRKKYQFNQVDATNEWITYFPRPLIFIEGLFIQSIPELMKYIDHVVYVDCQDEVRERRREVRDLNTRNSAITYGADPYHNHVLPAYHKYILPYRQIASFIINNSENQIPDISVLLRFISQFR